MAWTPELRRIVREQFDMTGKVVYLTPIRAFLHKREQRDELLDGLSLAILQARERAKNPRLP